MIVFDLICEHEHRFEGWFASSHEFDRQQECNLLLCAVCGANRVRKAPMSPAVGLKGNARARSSDSSQKDVETPLKGVERTDNPRLAALAGMFQAVAKAQAEALLKSRWVGDAFVETARQMHEGQENPSPIHGKASPEDAAALLDDGIAVLPIVVPFVPPDEVN